ncbi:MAG: cytochrome P460 family protein [Roseovarius sp.]|nr:cytochrome P460 family protein [Roseovarius sp.]
MKRHYIAATALTLGVMMGQQAAAQACAANVEDAFDLDEVAIAEIYACIGDQMAAAYAQEGNEVATAYRDWAVTATRPAVQGAHGNRLLLTFANDVAAEQYLKFAEEDVTMPAGSVLAKESITISTKNKEARVGPLFIMTKGEAGSAPETGDWVYAGLQPNGQPMKFKQNFCHDCHVAWETQDMMAYPVEEVRLSN